MPRNPNAKAAADFINESETHRCMKCTADWRGWQENGYWLAYEVNFQPITYAISGVQVVAKGEQWLTDAELIRLRQNARLQGKG